jgi:hypothetical protein
MSRFIKVSDMSYRLECPTDMKYEIKIGEISYYLADKSELALDCYSSGDHDYDSEYWFISLNDELFPVETSSDMYYLIEYLENYVKKICEKFSIIYNL